MHVQDFSRVHRDYELELRGVGHLATGASNKSLALLKRLPQAFQKRLSGHVVIKADCPISTPAFSRLFQLRSGEGPGYKERVQ